MAVPLNDRANQSPSFIPDILFVSFRGRQTNKKHVVPHSFSRVKFCSEVGVYCLKDEKPNFSKVLPES